MTRSAFLCVSACNLFVAHEEHRNTPNTCKSNYCVNYSCKHSGSSAADPCNKVEGEKTYKSPVECADDN